MKRLQRSMRIVGVAAAVCLVAPGAGGESPVAFKFRVEARSSTKLRYVAADDPMEVMCPGEEYAMYTRLERRGWVYAVKYHRVEGKRVRVMVHEDKDERKAGEQVRLGAAEWILLDDAEGTEAIYVIVSSKKLEPASLDGLAEAAGMKLSPSPGQPVPRPLTIIDKGNDREKNTKKEVKVRIGKVEGVAVYRFLFTRSLDNDTCALSPS
ncbi:hypothetical protein [Sorangium sp. So ce131]|uniref:hypothetical protein n=1 Tax=Sorangium sp. So ce131 TaxID=3133282 RepID=UPI003F6334EA